MVVVRSSEPERSQTMNGYSQPGGTTWREYSGFTTPWPRSLRKGVSIMSQYTMDAKQFQAALKAVQHAAKTDSPPDLRGVHLETWLGDARLTATDGYRLARYTIPATETHGESIFIPCDAVKELVSLPCGDGRAVIDIDGENYKAVLPQKASSDKDGIEYRMKALGTTGNFQRIGYKGGSEVSRKLATKTQIRAMSAPVVRWPAEQPKFPDFEKIIPPTFAGSAEFDRAELSHAVKMASIFCKNVDSGHVHPMGLKFTPGMVTVQSEETEKTERGDLEVDLQQAHNLRGTIGFNAKYLADALKAGDSETVVTEFNDALQPLVFRHSTNHFEMVMPLLVAGQLEAA